MIKFYSLVIFSFFCSIQSRAALQSVDGQETHGGNIILSEFWNIHNQVTATLGHCPRELGHPLLQQWLRQSVKTEVRTQERVFVGTNKEQEVVASNEPRRNPPLILISETRWPQLTSLEKIQITIHEILPVLGILDNDYVSSGEILERYKICTTPRFTKQAITSGLGRCDEAFIDQLEGPEIFTLNLTQAMYNAAYAVCAPALRKLRDFGGEVNRCALPYYNSELESPLHGFIYNYFGNGTREAKAYEFFMGYSRSELISDCDPEFRTACAEIATTSRVFPASKESLEALSKKLGCTL